MLSSLLCLPLAAPPPPPPPLQPGFSQYESGRLRFPPRVSTPPAHGQYTPSCTSNPAIGCFAAPPTGPLQGSIAKVEPWRHPDCSSGSKTGAACLRVPETRVGNSFASYPALTPLLEADLPSAYENIVAEAAGATYSLAIGDVRAGLLS